MNLVPIDVGSIAPATDVSTDATGTSVEFASIMTGLLAGDSQIAPVIDLPPTVAEVETELEGDTDQSSALLQLVGMPPSDISFLHPPPTHDPEAPRFSTEDPGATSALHVVSDVDATPADAISVSGRSVTSTSTATPEVIDAGQRTPSEADAATVLAQSIVPADQSSTGSIAQAPVATPGATAGRTFDTTAPTTAAPSTSALAGSLIGDAATTTTPPTPAAIPVTAPVDGDSVGPTVGQTTLSAGVDDADASTVEASTVPAGTTADTDVESTSWVRSLDAARPTVGGARQPIMVGIARRVEEAIAALATKPDPKIVTLQLDELDGVRLTVALRPDGVHLSSTGDARLTFDIERALAGRGFDLSSDDRGRQDREKPDESSAPDWRPRAAPRRRPSDPDAITL